MRKTTLLLFVLAFGLLAYAQQRTVTGQVRDEQGNPVGFATIVVTGTNNATQADVNGNFSLRVDNGAVLNITAVGVSPQRVTVTAGQNTYAVTVQRTNTELNTVVVTALGIRRSTKAITYATQNVSAERLTQTRDADFTNTLAGKVSGLTVNAQAGSKLGSTGTVRLRGVGSLNAAAAIYVVDGTIVTNPADINVDNIANISVLKGNAATNLYGSLAEGGVIIITSRKPLKSKRWTVDFNHTTTMDEVNVLPEYQNEYMGGGSTSWRIFDYDPAVHPAEWAQLDGKRYHDYSDDASWGPRMDGGEYIPWYAWYGGHKYSYQTENAVAQPKNIRQFYNKAWSVNNNIAISKGFERGAVRISYTNLNRTGLIPNSTLKKHFLSGNFTVDVVKNLTAAVNINYTTEDVRGDFNDGYSNNTSGSFNQWFHRNINMERMRELKGVTAGPNNTFISWNHVNPSNTSAPSANFYRGNYWYNPYTYLDQYYSKQVRQRLLGDATLTYRILKGLTATATYRLNRRPVEGEFYVPTSIKNGAAQSGILDAYGNNESLFLEQTGEATINYVTSVKDFSIDLLAGTQNIFRRSTDSSRATSGGLTRADQYTLDNSIGAVGRSGTFLARRATLGFFGRGTFGWKDLVYADFSVRREYNSRLPVESNGFTYPSYGLSVVLTDYVRKISPAVSFLKLRASRASVGSVPDNRLGEYALIPTYATGVISYNDNLFIAYPNAVVDPNIKPSINTATELGADMRFGRDRIGLGLTWYDDKRRDDIVATSVSGASGVTTFVLNAGLVTRKGWEVELNLKPIVSKDFNWDFTFNWSSVSARVDKVSDQSDVLAVSTDAFAQVQLVHIKGEKPFQIRGNGIKRINGLPVLNPDGTYVTESNVNFGSTIPDYFGGFFNGFAYKNFTLTASVDFSQGGKFYSLSDNWGTYSGLLAKTAATNDNGKNVREPVAEGGGVHVFGVDADGKPFDTYVDGFTYYHQFYGATPEPFIHDRSFIKLREVSLGYKFTTAGLGALGRTVKSMQLSFVGRNLWVSSRAKGFDPSELSAEWGENGQLPGTRSYGATLRLGF